MQQLRQALVVELFRKHGAMRRDDGNSELLRVLADQQLAGARLRRRQQHAGRGVRRVLHAVVVAVHADQHFDFVVVRRNVFVVDRPVDPEPVARVRLEIVRTVAQRDAAPVVGAAAEHARAPPPEALVLVFRGVRIRLARDLPAALDGGIVEAEFLVGRRRAAQRRLVGRVEHRRLGLGHVVAARFEHQDLRAVHRERVGRLAARCAGADDDHVVLLLQGIGFEHRHDGYFNFFTLISLNSTTSLSLWFCSPK